MNKVVIADQEFLILSQPIKTFIKLYGSASHLVNLVSMRVELFKWQSVEFKQISVVFDLITQFVPVQIGFKPLYIYNIIYIEYANSYRTYRHLFNLPVNGQRTWGGGRSIRILKSQLYHYKLKKFTKYLGMTNQTFVAEIVNLMWRQQWRHEWEVSKRYRDRLPWYVQRKKRWLNLSAMTARRIESFFKHPYKFKKKKHHRKKKKINKHVITTGFDFGFSRHLLKNLNSINVSIWEQARYYLRKITPPC